MNSIDSSVLSLAVAPVNDVSATPTLAPERGLTAAATAVLRALSNGLRPAQIAREGGVAMSTVRTHVSTVRMKTGTRSIWDLVRILMVLPPMVGVVAS